MLVFTGPSGQFRCPSRAWGLLARLAQVNGWSPTGYPRLIGPDGEEVWQSTELTGSADGFSVLVSEEDARALGAALKAALPDLPRFDALAHKSPATLDLPNRVPIRIINPGESISPYEFFSGANREALTVFVRLCESGALTVTAA
ncbi:MAG: hypothetical protein H7Y88_01520 [Phycisphaerales bacterium]|nr:hypothetical protein [Phycisphaerales bacterium]